MKPLFLQTTAAVAIFAITWLASANQLLRNNNRNTAQWSVSSEGFACGIFLGAALFHLLPNAAQQLHPWLHQNTLVVCIGTIISFTAFLYILEKILPHYFKLSENNVVSFNLFMVVIIIHAFISGLVLGMAKLISTTMVIALAILIHKGSESCAVSSKLCQQVFTHRKRLLLFSLFSVMTPFGILLGVTTQNINTSMVHIEGVFNLIACASFIYVAFDQHNTEEKALPTFRFLLPALIGLAIMAVLAIFC